MSGHSKWATIKHRKGAQDAKRGKLFTKIIKEITVAAKLGGGDPETNPRLRAALLNAKLSNMPKENIERAIKKGTGGLDGANYVELIYEGYGPGGVAIMVDALTDNKNRTAAEIRNIFSKGGGNLGEHGSVSYLFRKRGTIVFSTERYTEDDILEQALESGAEDVVTTVDSIEVVCSPDGFDGMLKSLEEGGFEFESASVGRMPETTVTLRDDLARRALKLIEALDDHDDVQEVSANVDIPDDLELS